MSTFAEKVQSKPSNSWAESPQTSAPAPASALSTVAPVGAVGDGVGGSPEKPKERPKLQLAKRSVVGAGAAAPSPAPSIFGGARTREEVLTSQGIDPATIDQKIEKKAAVIKLTRDQEQEIEAIRSELAYAEKELREANENELPELVFIEKVDAKKADLAKMMEQFAKINLEKEAARRAANPDQTYERPSERKKRQEQEAREREEGGGSGGAGGGKPQREGGYGNRAGGDSRGGTREGDKPRSNQGGQGGGGWESRDSGGDRGGDRSNNSRAGGDSRGGAREGDFSKFAKPASKKADGGGGW